MSSRSLGKFWLPGASDTTVPGLLRLRKGAPSELVVHGRLGEPTRTDLPEVLGETPRHGPVTLRHLRCTKEFPVSHGPGEATYEAWTAIVGRHTQRDEGVRFSKMHIRLSGFRKWVLGRSYLRLDRGNNRIEIQQINPPPASSTGRLAGFSVDFRAYPFTSRSGAFKASIKPMVQLVVSTEAERPLEDYNTVIRMLQHFVSFVTDVPCRVEDLHGSTKVDTPAGVATPGSRDEAKILTFGEFF
jgi:hypothetical protein